MTRLVAIVLAVAALAACKQGQSGAGRAHRPGGRDRGADEPVREGQGDATPPEPAPPCGGVGTPWDGKAEGCVYEHEGCCYADAETACKAAACAPEHCTVLETAPAQIACDTPQ